MTLRYATVCSGIEAPTVAIHGVLEWRPAWFSEIAEFPSRVLATRWPEVPNRGDFTKIQADAGPVDVLLGGTPCQDFSIAGSGSGLDGANGNLALEFVRLLARLTPRWVVWENVDGSLSNNEGRDFGAILGALADLRYHLAWRVLDAQFFGVPQRRRRVFVVGHLGDWRPPAAVLFERESLRRHPAEKRRARRDDPERAAASIGNDRVVGTLLASNVHRGYRFGPDEIAGGQYVASESGVARCLTSRHCHRYDARTDNFVIGGRFDALSIAENQRGEVVTSEVTQALSSGGGKPGQGYPAVMVRDGGGFDDALAFHHEQDPISGEVSPAPSKGAQGMGVQQGRTIRRLSPLECERLMGLPDLYTAIDGASDSNRYEAIGNSMAVPVMRWILTRLDYVDSLRRRT